MNSSIPPPSLELREPLVVALAGDSIELKALASGLSQERATVQWLASQSTLGPRRRPPRLIVCDLASDGSLAAANAALGHFANQERGPELVTVGSPQRPLSIELARVVHNAARRYPRPLNITEVLREIIQFGNRARATATRQSSLPAMLTGRRSSSLPPPRDTGAPATPTSAPQPPQSASPANPRGDSSAVASGAQEPTAISPELEFLLADAQHKLQSWVSERPLQSEPAPAIDPEDRHLAENVWQALSEPLDEQDAQDHWHMPSTGAAVSAEEADSDELPPTGRGTRPPLPPSEKNSSPLARTNDSPEEDTSSQVAAREGTVAHPLIAEREVERVEPFAGGNTVADVAASLAASAPPSEASLMPTLSPPSRASIAPGTIAQLRSIAPTDLPPHPLRSASIAPATTRAEPRGSIAPAGASRTPAGAEAITPHPLPKSPDSKPLTRRTLESQSPERYSPSRPASDPPGGKADPVDVERDLSVEALEDATPTRAPKARPSPTPFGDGSYQLPRSLTPGATHEVLAQAVRQRFTGCLSFEVDQGLRRAVMRDGDFVVAASAVHGESLVSFLVKRGDVSSETAQTVGHRIPMQGRYAGAALIAHGLIEQGDLWAVLRAHAEAVLTQIMQLDRGHVEAEAVIPERLAAEPAVFGGATGAEVFVEIVRRSVSSRAARQFLQQRGHQLHLGTCGNLLSECALGPRLTQQVDKAQREPLPQLLEAAVDEPSLPCVLYALLLMKVLEAAPTSRKPPAPFPPSEADLSASKYDPIDDDALREKIQNRRALVDNGDYFSVLGVEAEATGYEIRRSYLDLRKQFAPEVILRPGTVDLSDQVDEILEVLHEAYDVLKDSRRRERYRAAIEARPS